MHEKSEYEEALEQILIRAFIAVGKLDTTDKPKT
jgi:hypothetical protein